MATDAGVFTASAYVLVRGLFVFQVGPTRSGDQLGVVRLGGHMEPGESSLACAIREAFEEATLRIQPVAPPATYIVADDASLRPAPPPDGELAPLLISRHAEGLSVTYLAHSDDEPVPGAESRGLLLLDRSDVLRLTAEPLTLGQFLNGGGRALLREPLPLNLPLEPFPHLRLLPRVLALHPHLGERTH
jgi:8-oxo-dGTP pyrophosphatase MutT (NUDIX family)